MPVAEDHTESRNGLSAIFDPLTREFEVHFHSLYLPHGRFSHLDKVPRVRLGSSSVCNNSLLH
jgi:hypothetical protein